MGLARSLATSSHMAYHGHEDGEVYCCLFVLRVVGGGEFLFYYLKFISSTRDAQFRACARRDINISFVEVAVVLERISSGFH